LYFCGPKSALGYTAASAIGIEVEILFSAAAKPPRKKDCNVKPDPAAAVAWQGIAQIIVIT